MRKRYLSFAALLFALLPALMVNAQQKKTKHPCHLG